MQAFMNFTVAFLAGFGIVAAVIGYSWFWMWLGDLGVPTVLVMLGIVGGIVGMVVGVAFSLSDEEKATKNSTKTTP